MILHPVVGVTFIEELNLLDIVTLAVFGGVHYIALQFDETELSVHGHALCLISEDILLIHSELPACSQPQEFEHDDVIESFSKAGYDNYWQNPATMDRHIKALLQVYEEILMAPAA